MLLGGTDDTPTPTESFLEVWDALRGNGIGGALAELIGGTHNDDAWAPSGDFDNPQDYNFGRYQLVTELWWDIYLNDEDRRWRELGRVLGNPQWDASFTDGMEF